METIRDEEDVLKLYKSGLYELQNKKFRAKSLQESDMYEKMIQQYKKLISDYEQNLITDSNSVTDDECSGRLHVCQKEENHQTTSGKRSSDGKRFKIIRNEQGKPVKIVRKWDESTCEANGQRSKSTQNRSKKRKKHNQ